jgi:tripartite-type tricarboxylate transporter receptor subunit TctC
MTASLNRRQLLARTGAAALAPALLPLGAHAQAGWPSRPVKIVVPYAPGGANDIVARIVSEKLTSSLGQSVVVENRPGAAAIVGTEFVAKSPADGYTLLMAASGPIVFNPALYAKLPYDSLHDFAPVSMAGSFPLILAVHEAFPAKTLAELVAWSKEEGHKPNYSYPAASFQLIMELVKARSGLRALNVPYKGSAPSINAVMTREVQMTLIDSGPIAPLLKGGKLRALAVTSEQRLPSYPDVPTLKEQGIDLAVNLWTGLLAPAATPAPVVKRLQDEMMRTMALPDVVDRLQKLDIHAIGSTSAQFTQEIGREITQWTQVARENHIHIE